MKIAKKELVYVAMVAITLLLLVLIVLEIPKIQQDLKENIQANMVRSVNAFLHNFENEVQPIVAAHPDHELSEVIENDPALQKQLETILSMLIADEVQYCYAVFRDENGKFRFMLDGARHDRAEFGRKFDIESDVWLKAYETGQPQLVDQSNLSTLWITYLYPIVIDGKMHGIIAADFSLESYRYVINILQPLQKYIWIFMGLIFMGIVVSAIQYFLYRLSQKQVFIDPLTGVYNRHFLNSIIGSFDYQKYAVAMLDLDKFKIINDTYGHETGDLVLRHVASALKSSLREHDRLIRYGGEEFLVFVSLRDTDPNGIMGVMERLRQNVASLSIPVGLIDLHPTLSIGLNFYTSHFKNEHDAIAVADKMLYEAKRSGRNKIASYHPSAAETGETKHFTVHHVKEAIEEKRLFCEYQPIVDLTHQKIAGYEALIRIRDRDGSTVYPGMFLPQIAQCNIYKELTLELLRMNFETIRERRCAISLNLNLTDLLDDDIYHTIHNRLGEAQSDARLCTFELLEEEQITDLPLLQSRIASLRALGATISIDDFGTGYSNFTHLFALDIDVIKIDGSLIRDIHTSEVSRKLVESIVAFARASGKRITAEFIHSAEVLEHVRSLGITHGQGFYLGKPAPLPDAAA